jgi:hypothetical protein
MMQSIFTVPEKVSFPEAIQITESLLLEMEAGHLLPEAIEIAIASLVKSANGARGFFVTYLTSDQSAADNPSASVVQGLQTNPDLVADLLVKNLAMSTGMAITHLRNQDPVMAQQSARVSDRTVKLIKQLKLTKVQELSSQLAESIVTGSGNYQEFLDRWGYDVEQRQAIREALPQIAPEC